MNLFIGILKYYEAILVRLDLVQTAQFLSRLPDSLASVSSGEAERLFAAIESLRLDSLPPLPAVPTPCAPGATSTTDKKRRGPAHRSFAQIVNDLRVHGDATCQSVAGNQ